MPRLKIEAEINGQVVTVEKVLAPEADAPSLAWCEAAYPGTPEAPLSGAGSIDAAIRGVMQGILDNINRHAVEQAKAAAEASTPQLTA